MTHDDRAATGDSAPRLEETGDADLVLRTRGGDQHAFGELWRRHYRSGITVARSVTSSLDPDDLVQEAYTRIFQSIQRGGGPTGSFRAYLFTSIRNTAAAWGRARRETAIDELDAVEDPATSEQATNDALDRSITVLAFRSLPTRWQEVLWYTEIEGMKPAEVAPLLGMKATAVAQLAFRAREGLREAWIQAHLRSVEDGSECAWTIERLGAYARNNLGTRDRHKLETHLADCARCAIVAAEAKDVGGRLALVLLPLTVGIAGTAAYLASLQGGGTPLVALAAMPSSVVEGAVVAGTAGAGTAGAGAAGSSTGSAGAGAGSAGAAAAAGSAGGAFAGVGAIVGIAAAAVVVAGSVVAAAVVPGLISPAGTTADAGLHRTVDGEPDGSGALGGPIVLPSASPDDPVAPSPDPTTPVDAPMTPPAPAPGTTAPPTHPAIPSTPSVKPSEPTDPTNPVGPTDPGPTDPGPTDPTSPVGPTDPVTPTVPVTPTDPTTPTTPDPALPEGSPQIASSNSYLDDRLRVNVDIALTGEPGATIEALIDGAVRATGTVGDDGTLVLTIRPTLTQLVRDADVQFRYVAGDKTGPVTAKALSALL